MMLSGIFEKLLLCALAVVMAIGIGTTTYAIYEHHKVTAAEAAVETARLETAQANANYATAASEASATRAAFAAQATQLQTARDNHKAATTRLAAAVAANPNAANSEVSKDIWDAIYGDENAKK